MSHSLSTIETWDCQDSDIDLTTLLTRSEPVVLRQFVHHWPVVRQALSSNQAVAQYLSSMATEEPVTVYQGTASGQKRVFYSDDMSGFNFTPSHATLDEVLTSLVATPDTDRMLYVGSTLIDRWLPAFNHENFIEGMPADALRSIWLGNQTQIPAHFDFPDNLACVVAGRRRFTLFPPDQVKNLYVGPLERTPAGQPISLVDLDEPNLDNFPRFEEALEHAQSAELNAGDAIFVPSMWWHHVASLDSLNILINYWWRNTPHYLGNPTNALFHALLSIGQLPDNQKHAWQNLFEQWVFNTDEHRLDHLPDDAKGVLGSINEPTARKLRADLINKLNR